MNPFSEEFRKERESKNITLADISHKTRINIKYLQAIEQGAFDILPQTYVRAFIKAYAEAIGITASEALKKYDIHSTPEHKEETANIKDEARLYLRPEAADEQLKKEKNARALMVTTALAVAALLIVFYLLNYFGSVVPSKPTKETAFQEVVKEQEKLQPVAAVVDSVDTTKIAKIEIPKADSLVLRVIATDSVWLTIIRDSLPPRSGYMLRGRYRTYVAKKGFYLSLSDAAAVKLILNGIELPALGEPGKRIRNIKINADDLQIKQ